jgi:hypothetical protein
MLVNQRPLSPFFLEVVTRIADVFFSIVLNFAVTSRLGPIPVFDRG